jgi:hypothetical protein
MMLDRGKRFRIAPDPHLGHDSFTAAECLACLSLPNSDLSQRFVSKIDCGGPWDYSLPATESRPGRAIRPSRRYGCCARQIRSRFPTAAAHAEPMRFVKLHSAWYRFHLRRLAASVGMPGSRGRGAGGQTWAGSRPAGNVHCYSALVKRPAHQPHSTANPLGVAVRDLCFPRSPDRPRSCPNCRGHRIRWNHPPGEADGARSTPLFARFLKQGRLWERRF